MADRWIKCIATHGNIRGVAIQAHDLLARMAQAHGLSGAAARSLGEAVIGALLISSYSKEGERINLNIRGTGNIRQALIDAYPDGTVRGYVVEHNDQLREGPSGTDGPWGDGVLSILRTKDGQGERPYIGTVPLVTGHLAKDLTFYWAQSEQIPSAVGIAVNLQEEKLGSAGGFLVQILPGASSDEVKLIEQHIIEIQSLAKRLAERDDPMGLLAQIFQDTAFVVVEEKPLEFRCNCTAERVHRALALVGAAELRDMLQQDGGASVRCDFCAREYKIGSVELKSMISRIEGNGC